MTSTEASLADLRLWRSVILQAITDATGNTTDLHAEKVQREARDWLTSGGEDFAEVCAAAGLDPIRVRRNAAELIAKVDAKSAKPVRRSSDRRRPDNRPGNRRGRKPSIFIEHDGLSLTISEWSKRLGVPAATIDARRRAGLPAEQMLAPSQARFGNGSKTRGRGRQATSSDRLGTGGGSSAQDCG